MTLMTLLSNMQRFIASPKNLRMNVRAGCRQSGSFLVGIRRTPALPGAFRTTSCSPAQEAICQQGDHDDERRQTQLQFVQPADLAVKLRQPGNA